MESPKKEAVLTDEQKIIRIKALQAELSAALEEAKTYKGDSNKDQTTFSKIEGILNQIDDLTKSAAGSDNASPKTATPGK